MTKRVRVWVEDGDVEREYVGLLKGAAWFDGVPAMDDLRVSRHRPPPGRGGGGEVTLTNCDGEVPCRGCRMCRPCSACGGTKIVIYRGTGYVNAQPGAQACQQCNGTGVE